MLKQAIESDLMRLNLTALPYMNLSAQFPIDRNGHLSNSGKLESKISPNPNPGIWCRQRGRLWKVVSYRPRPGTLHMFTQHIHHVLQTQRLEYRVVVVEQLDSDARFSRAKFFNAAVSEIARHTLERWLPRDEVDLKPDEFIHCDTPATELTAHSNQINQSEILDKHQTNFYQPTTRRFLTSQHYINLVHCEQLHSH